MALFVAAVAGLPGVAASAAARPLVSLPPSVPPATVYMSDNTHDEIALMSAYDEVYGALVPTTNLGPTDTVVSPTENVAYVLTQGAIDILDMSSESIVATVPIAGSLLWNGVVSPDGQWLYVADSQGGANAGRVHVMSTTAPYPVTQVMTGGTAALSVALNETGTRLYAGHTTGNQIVTIDTSNNQVVGSPITVTGQAWDVARSRDGSRLLVSTKASHITAVPIAADGTLGAPTTIGNGGCAVNSTVQSLDGADIYGMCLDGTVERVDAATGTVEASVPVGWNGPIAFGAITPDGSRLYVSSHGDNAGFSLDLTTRTANSVGTPGNSTINGGGTPWRISIVGVPAAPAAGGPATVASGQATVSFTAPAITGNLPILQYRVVDSVNGVDFPCPATTSPCTVTGLTNGTTYNLEVQAVNSFGRSAGSSPITATPRTTPSAPTIGVATAGDTQASVHFAAPGSDGGSPIDQYRAVDAAHLVDFPCPLLTSPCVVTGLSNGTSYDLTIVAHNAIGDSLPSSSVGVTPAKAPDAPTIGPATAAGSQVSVAFTANASNGAPITGYTATDAGNSVSFACPLLTSPCVVTGLANGTTYTFTIHATNSAGTSLESAPANPATPAAGPGRPTITGAHRGNAKITIDYTDGLTGGSAITGHTATDTTHGSFPCVGTGGHCEVLNLTNGTAYTFTLRATNSAGSSPESNAASTITPATVPGAPAITAAVAGNAQVTLTFVDGSTGGDPITSHAVTWTTAGGSGSTSCATNPCLITGLTNGTAYTFTAKSTNGVGDSAGSAPTRPVTPVTQPTAPVITSLAAAGAGAVITVTAPSDNGGSAITGYQVRVDGGAWIALTTAGTGPYTARVNGLPRGAAHRIAVRAVNATGAGAASPDSVLLIPDVPSPPIAVTAVAGNARATVSFAAPGNDGGAGITGYLAVAAPGGASATCDDSPCTVTGLHNGRRYTFTVRALNAVGLSADSAPSGAVTPAGPPGAPGNLTGTPTATSIELLYSAGDDGGSPIIRYEVSVDGGTTWSTLGGQTVDRLTPGTAYTVALRAVNEVGTGPASGSIVVTTLPPPMPAPVATAGVSSVTVSWAKATTGTVTGYAVYAWPGPATCTTASRDETSCVIGGAAGTAYTFTVVAHTPSGDSATSDASNVATPLSPPVPPAAPPASPTLRTPDGQPARVTPGQALDLIGTGFAAHSTAKFTLYSEPVVLGTVVTDGYGRFAVRGITLPPGLEPGPHTLIAAGVDPAGRTYRISMNFTVRAAAPAPGGRPEPDLPVTGGPASPIAVLGFVLIVAGVWLVRRPAS
ncbi:fibronectin type III domain-containing protein [Paractinoplanes rishiriensis]|uniref:fibronectin type III domain-containing protein n=1 Tax=Paractinoplanes rishiriensis TaxID=1050105 RepID=UPI001941DF8C|nr:fibronectin type III domain-containing protein [Actinoplanes rishiriensis]